MAAVKVVVVVAMEVEVAVATTEEGTIGAKQHDIMPLGNQNTGRYGL